MSKGYALDIVNYLKRYIINEGYIGVEKTAPLSSDKSTFDSKSL